MAEGDRAAFLRQAFRNNWQQYLASLQPGPRAAQAGWDVCVLTAADERQAIAYRQQLDWRRQGGLLPARTRFLAMADPGGRHIGSGGATLRVLHHLCAAAELAPDTLAAQPAAAGFRGGRDPAAPASPLQTLRVAIIHSGGDSRRLPHCSAAGKLFARVPRTLPDGRASTIFDEFLIGLSGLSAGLPPGVLVASGDVLLVYDHLQLAFQRPGVIGVAVDVPAETGTEHGVYALDERGRLRAYLHKPSIAEMNEWQAIDAQGSVPVDSGLVWADAATANRWVRLTQDASIAALAGLAPPPDHAPGGGAANSGLNLYGDLLLPLAASTTYEGYLSDTSVRPTTPTVQAARRTIWDQLRGTPFTVQRLRPAVFVHVSTSHEYWQAVAADRELAQVCDWTRQAVAWLDAPARPAEDRLVLVNATLEGPIDPGSKPGLVADSWLSGPLAWSGAALLAGVFTAQPLALGEDVVLHQLAVDGQFVTRIYGLHDDPKRAWTDPVATVMNCTWAEWLTQTQITPELLWPGLPPDEWTLWNARLYPLAADREASLRLSLPLQDAAHLPDGWRAGWEAGERLSLAESYRRADSRLILTDATAVEDRIAVQHACAAIRTEQPAAETAALLGATAHARERRCKQASQWLARADPIQRLRGYKTLYEATGDVAWEDAAFATLAEMIEASVQELQTSRTPQREQRSSGTPTSVQVEASARVDCGGGWTDTPPYSIERGGRVLNLALTLKGAYPIVVEATRLSEPRLVLECRDIDMVLEPEFLGEVLACANPADPFCLPKAALVLRGLVPADGDPGAPLAEVLRASGGGLRLMTATSIPRGSGLGTSSILGGAVLACLGRLQGVELSQAALFDEVLCLEQMMTTGGGWQDQVGGLVGGIKLVRSDPGLPQVIQVDPLVLSPQTEAELARRLVLVYTGQQRLAKNLLRIVVGRWLARDPEMVWLLGEIARLADEMCRALRADDVTGFGELLSEHWALNKRIDPGCTNLFIDGLFEDLTPHIHGGKLAGAGGGGFAIVVTRGQDGERELAEALRARYANTPVAVWPSAIPAQAMVVHTNL